jgi:hypothetical protein
MLEIAVTDEMRARAEAKANELGELHNSVTRGEGNIYGCLGEELLLAALPGSISSSTYEFDARYEGLRLDVKSYRCIAQPKPSFECTVYAFNTHQATDYYVFVRILEDLSKGWVLGCMSKSDFYRKAHFGRKGDAVPGQIMGGRPFRYKADCYTVLISDLAPVENLKNEVW